MTTILLTRLLDTAVPSFTVYYLRKQKAFDVEHVQFPGRKTTSEKRLADTEWKCLPCL